MATFSEFLKKAVSMGVTESEMPQAINDYDREFGFDPEDMPYSPNLALKLAQKNFINTLSMQKSSLVRNVLTDEEITNRQNHLFENFYQQFPYSDDAYSALRDIQYANLSPAQILNENSKILNYEPWLTPYITDRSATPIERIQGFSGKVVSNIYRIGAGFTSIAFDLEAFRFSKGARTLKTFGLDSLSEIFQKQSDTLSNTSDELYSIIMRNEKKVTEAITGQIPFYVKDDIDYMIGESLGELPFLAIGFIPVVGMPLLGATTVSRYYQEGLEESNGNELIAAAYTTIFAPLAFAVDRITLGLPKRLKSIVNNPNFGRKSFFAKQLKITTGQSLKAGGGEFLTETAESAYLQKVTKGTIDWKQARLEGFLAFITGTVGGSITGSISTAQNVKRVNKLIKFGMDENTASGVIDLIINGDPQTAADIALETVSEKVNKFLGVEFSALGNVIIGDGKFRKYTFGKVRQIAKLPRQEILEKVLDAKNDKGEFIIDRRFRDEAEVAFFNPTKENVDALNKKIEEVAKEDNAFTESDLEQSEQQKLLAKINAEIDRLREERKKLQNTETANEDIRLIDKQIAEQIRNRKIVEAFIEGKNISDIQVFIIFGTINDKYTKKSLELNEKYNDEEITAEELTEGKRKLHSEMINEQEKFFQSAGVDYQVDRSSEEVLDHNIKVGRYNNKTLKKEYVSINAETGKTHKGLARINKPADENIESNEYEDMSFQDLRNLANQRGIKARSKKELIKRLKAKDADLVDKIINRQIERQRQGEDVEENEIDRAIDEEIERQRNPNSILTPQEEKIIDLELILQNITDNEKTMNTIKSNANLDTLATLQAIEIALGFSRSETITEDFLYEKKKLFKNPIYRAEVIRRVNLLKQFLFESNSDLIPRVYAKEVLDTFAYSILQEAKSDGVLERGFQEKINLLINKVVPYIKNGDILGLENSLLETGIDGFESTSEIFRQRMADVLFKVQEINKAYNNNALNFLTSDILGSFFANEVNVGLVGDDVFLSQDYEYSEVPNKLQLELLEEILSGNVTKKQIKKDIENDLKEDKQDLTEEQIEDLTDEELEKMSFERKIIEFREEVDIIYEEILLELPTFDRELSKKEQDQFIRYILFKQGYQKIQTGVDEKGDPIFDRLEDNESEIKEDLLEYINAAREQFKKLADEFDEVKEALGIDFNRNEWYFPLKRRIKNKEQQGEIEDLNDLVDQHKGFTLGRTGSTVGIVPDPVFQVQETLNDIISATRIGVRQIELTKKIMTAEKIESLSSALKKIKVGFGAKIVDTDLTEAQIKQFELTDKESEAYEIFQDLHVLEKAKLETKIPTQRNPVLSPLFISLVESHKNNNLSQDLANIGNIGFIPDGKFKKWLIKNGQSWANTVDPHFVVQKMDGSSLVDNVDEDGKVIGGKLYGSNAVIWHSILRAVNLARQEDINLQRLQQTILDGLSENELKSLNRLLHNVFFENEKSKRALKRVHNLRNPKQLQETLKEEGYAYNGRRLTLKESEIVLAYAKLIRGRSNRIVLGSKRRGQLANISSEAKKRFFILEKKVEDGEATDQELAEYKAIGGTLPEKTQLDVLRKIHRFIFEQQAIAEKNFFGWFEGTMAQANKGAFFDDIIDQTEVWADYLETVGETGNADWWRTKIEVNLKGNLFKFEDQLLGWTAANIKKFANKINSSDQLNLDDGKLPTGILNAIKAATIDDIKLATINAGSWLQKARINAFLLGNIGWVLTTQPSSLAFTIKQAGVKETLKQFGLMPNKGAIVLSDPDDRKYLGENLLVESQVVGIKRSGKEVTAVEATDPLREDTLIKTKRQVARNGLGMLGSWMENRLTLASFNAGYNHAKNKLGLNDDQAMMHGDFVAAATQSMYDRVTRNSALNSNMLRFFRPMQSFVFTAYSNVLDTFGVVGVKRSVKVRAAEAARFLLASRMWNILWSMIFGDDLLKAIYNPQFDKGTIGSAIPLFGLNVDIKMSQSLPWLDDQGWKSNNAQQQFMKSTVRIIKAFALGQPNAERELLVYTFRYITPSMGIGGSVPLQNLTKLVSAKLNNNTFEDIKGGEMSKLSDNYATYPLGLFFGRKIMDKREMTTFEKIKTARAEVKKREEKEDED
jgi:urease gamma subunit